MAESGNTGSSSATNGGDANQPVSVRFPSLKQLEEDTERAKLEQARAESQAATAKARLPSPDTLTAETVTAGDKTTGLAAILVQRGAGIIAHDIARLALDAARQASEVDSDALAVDATPDPSGADPRHSYVFRVTSDSAVLSSIDTYRLLDGQLIHFERRISAADAGRAASRTMAEPAEPHGEAGGSERGERLIAPALAAAIPLASQVVGLASKLLARNYQISSAVVAADDLGFDLSVAHALRTEKYGDERVEAQANRLLPTPDSSKILERVWSLATTLEQKLLPTLAGQGAALARTKATADAAGAALTALDSEILELVKRLPDGAPAPELTAKEKKKIQPVSEKNGGSSSGLTAALDERVRRRGEILANLPGIQSAIATAQSAYDEGTALRDDVEAFLTAALAPPQAGGRPPALDAARVEPLIEESDDKQLLLYARITASGLDEDLSTGVARAKDDIIVGLSSEFALVDTSGRLLATGVRPVLHHARFDLKHPDVFTMDPIGSTVYSRKEPTPATSPAETNDEAD